MALGVASLVAMAGAYRDLGRSYQRTYDELRLADATFALQGAPDSALSSIAAVPGVKAVFGRLITDVGLVLPGGEVSAESEQIRSRLIGIPSDRHPEVNDVLVLSGRYLKPGDSASVLLESHFAHAYGLVPGDSVTPVIEGRRVALQVVGVVASPEYLIVSPSKQEIIPSARTFAVLFVPPRRARAAARSSRDRQRRERCPDTGCQQRLGRLHSAGEAGWMGTDSDHAAEGSAVCRGAEPGP